MGFSVMLWGAEKLCLLNNGALTVLKLWNNWIHHCSTQHTLIFTCKQSVSEVLSASHTAWPLIRASWYLFVAQNCIISHIPACISAWSILVRPSNNFASGRQSIGSHYGRHDLGISEFGNNNSCTCKQWKACLHWSNVSTFQGLFPLGDRYQFE